MKQAEERGGKERGRGEGEEGGLYLLHRQT
jgi:hypothetical protein